MAGRPRPEDRQRPRGARLGFFAGRRRLHRRGIDRCRDPLVDAFVAYGGVPQPGRAGSRRDRSRREPGRAPRDAAPNRAEHIAMYTRGAIAEAGAAGAKALEIAKSLDDAEYQLRALWRLWHFRISGGQHRVALTLAQRFYSLAAKSAPNELPIGERMIGSSEYYLGDLPSARRYLERV